MDIAITSKRREYLNRFKLPFEYSIGKRIWAREYRTNVMLGSSFRNSLARIPLPPIVEYRLGKRIWAREYRTNVMLGSSFRNSLARIPLPPIVEFGLPGFLIFEFRFGRRISEFDFR
jgi:hypothetical protein